MKKSRSILIGLKALLLGATIFVSSLASSSVELQDFSQLKVYGVQRPSLSSIDEAKVMLNHELANKTMLSPDAKEELHRFLFYDALNHYVGFLLNITNQPDLDYVASFSPLQEIVKDDFVLIQTDALQQAAAITRKIRFDVSMVYEYSKNIYNAEEGALISNDADGVLSRLAKVSTKLNELYPTSEGELPTTLVAFVASVFTPFDIKVHASCPEHMPEQLKNRALHILASPQANLVPEALASPVKNTHSLVEYSD